MDATRNMLSLVGLVAVVAAAVAVSACDVIVTSLDAKGKAQDQWTRSYPITASGRVEILNTNGEIEVTGSDGGQVEVVAERIARAATDEDAAELLKQIEISEETAADRVRLQTRTPKLDGRRVEVKYHVKVPASVSVRLENTNGLVTVNGVKGSVTAGTTNGGVRGRDLSGAVEASSSNGSVTLDVNAIASGGIRASTSNGAVDVTVPGSARASVRATCVNGGIRLTGLSLEGGETTRRRVEGRLNGGGPNIVLDTVNGRIRIIGK